MTSEPRLLAYQGKMLWSALRTERMTEADVLAAVRAHGASSLDEVDAVVLETHGSVSVIQRRGGGPDTALRPVRS